MVTYIPAGRLGNVCFQVAMIFQYALKHGIDFHVPSVTDNKKWNPLYFPHLQNPNFNPNLATVIVKEKTHAYHEVPFEDSWRNKNIFLSGYWQSSKYFDWCRDELLKALQFKWQPEKDLVAVHVRRGDYLLYPEKHPPVSKQYYLDAMELIKQKENRQFQFLFFSDDIAWCKETFKRPFNPFISYSDVGLTPLEDLEIMSWCSHQICSSSTFALWGYWLNQNPNKIGIFPKLWFMPGHGGLETKDIVPPECIKI